MVVASNTSPISNLVVIGRLSLLRSQFREIWIPGAVQSELHQLSDPAPVEEINRLSRTVGSNRGRFERTISRGYSRLVRGVPCRVGIVENAFGPGLPWCACDSFRPVRALAGAPPASIGYER